MIYSKNNNNISTVNNPPDLHGQKRGKTMAKSTKNAVLICSILTAVAVLASILGIIKSIPIAVVLGMVPVAAYETYRTEGITTKFASIGIFIILIIEVVIIAKGMKLDNIEALTRLKKTIPFLEISMIAPVLTAFLSFTLFRRTYGIYTRWLAAVILLTSIALLYSVNPSIVEKVKNSEVKEVLKDTIKNKVRRRY